MAMQQQHCCGSCFPDMGTCVGINAPKHVRQARTSIAVAVAQAHVQQRNLVHLMDRERADAALLTVALRLHKRLRKRLCTLQHQEAHLFMVSPQMLALQQCTPQHEALHLSVLTSALTCLARTICSIGNLSMLTYASTYKYSCPQRIPYCRANQYDARCCTFVPSVHRASSRQIAST